MEIWPNQIRELISRFLSQRTQLIKLHLPSDTGFSEGDLLPHRLQGREMVTLVNESKWDALSRLCHDEGAVQRARFEVRFAEGSLRKGLTHEKGQARLEATPAGPAQVRFEPDARPYPRADGRENLQHKEALEAVFSRFDLEETGEASGSTADRREP